MVNPNPATCPEKDQRGILRPVDGDGDGIAQCNIGAFEYVHKHPAFTSTPITKAIVGTLYLYDITATDPDPADMLTISAPTLPGWLTVADNGDGTAVLCGTPSQNEVGDHSVELLVTDGEGLTDTQLFTITAEDEKQGILNKLYLPLILY